MEGDGDLPGGGISKHDHVFVGWYGCRYEEEKITFRDLTEKKLIDALAKVYKRYRKLVEGKSRL